MLRTEKCVTHGDFLQIGAEKGNPYAQLIMKLYLSTRLNGGRQLENTADWLRNDAGNIWGLSFL